MVLLGAGIYYHQVSPDYPDISRVRYTLLDGRHLEMQALKGRPVIITFWATSCVSCIKEIPGLIQLYQNYSSKGLEIIGVAMPYDRPDHVLEFAQSRHLAYPIALDIDAAIVKAFGDIQITPNNFLVDTKGRIVKQQIGILDIKDTERWLQSATTNMKY
jgi:peroxiredoxin